ncbi:MAG: NAD(P)-dependent oxidoreductase [Candidatus Rokuibacteriota bacterium]
MKIGFIGLGTMGRHMASNLIKAGHRLVVHDARREATAPHREAGAAWAETPREAAEAADVVFTSLPGPPEVEAVALGEQGLLTGLAAGTVYFDLTTNAPALVRRIHEVFRSRGIHMLDAPVSGGPRGAETRRLALWVGGDEAVFQRYKPVLEAIGDRPCHVGPIGAGSVVKLVHNCAGYVIQTALAEVFTMGARAGVDPLALWKALREGAGGRRRTFDGLVDQFLPGRFEPAAFALRLAHKDMTLATTLGREYRVPMRLASITLDEMTEALNRGWGERDSRVAMLLQEERAGVEIVVPEAAIRQVLELENGVPGQAPGMTP